MKATHDPARLLLLLLAPLLLTGCLPTEADRATFVITVYNNQGKRIPRRVHIAATGWTADDQVSYVTHPDIGAAQEGTVEFEKTTVYRYTAILLEGVVQVDIWVTYLGQAGDILECFYIHKGVASAPVQMQLRSGTKRTPSVAEVACEYRMSI